MRDKEFPLGFAPVLQSFPLQSFMVQQREREREGGGREESATQHTLEELLQEPGLVCNRVPAKVNGLVGEKGQLVQRRDDLAVLCIARERCVCVCVNVCE